MKKTYTAKDLVSLLFTILSVCLGVIWLIPLVWLVGTALTETSFHMTLLPSTPFTLENVKYVWNAIPFAQYYINTLTLQQLCKAALLAVLFALILVTPVHAGDNAIYAITIYGAQVVLDGYRVDVVYMLTFGSGDAISAVGVVHKGEPHATPLEVEDIVAGVVRAIGIYSRVRYAVLVELLDGHVDASRKAVAAVVIR